MHLKLSLDRLWSIDPYGGRKSKQFVRKLLPNRHCQVIPKKEEEIEISSQFVTVSMIIFGSESLSVTVSQIEELNSSPSSSLTVLQQEEDIAIAMPALTVHK